MSQPSASRIIAGLEKEIGASLFIHTTRALLLTQAGAEYLARVEPALAALDEADHIARGTGELRGVVRVAAPSSFTLHALIPKIGCIPERPPEPSARAVINDQRQSLVADHMIGAFRE